MFSQVVSLYRALGSPDIEDGGFAFKGQVTDETLELLNQVHALPIHFGKFDAFHIVQKTVDVEFKVPASEYGQFYRNMVDFVRLTPTLNWGEMPHEYFIVDLKFYSGDTVKPDSILRLSECCEFVRLISLLAADVSSSEVSKANENRLVFVLVADGKSASKTISMKVKINASVLEFSLPHLNLLKALLSDVEKNQIHIEERRNIMLMAIADTLSGLEADVDAFSYLVRQWRKVLFNYRYNVLAFLNKYSFEKVRKEIANAEIEHATKLSAVLGDVAGKIMALPLSLAAIILLRNAKTKEEFIVIAIGLFSVSIIFLGIIINQWLQVLRLRTSFDTIFEQYSREKSPFPAKLLNPVKKAKRAMKFQFCVLNGTFLVFSFLAILPSLGATYVILDMYKLFSVEFVWSWFDAIGGLF